MNLMNQKLPVFLYWVLQNMQGMLGYHAVGSFVNTN